jgi:3-phenylpropionate/cinnamic acid dioxygenase small subunit
MVTVQPTPVTRRRLAKVAMPFGRRLRYSNEWRLLMDSRSEIENLMAKYCRLYDNGDLEGYADLFAHATISGMDTAEQIVTFHRQSVHWYDGEPRTRHVITNIEIDVDEAAGTANGQSYVTVYQALPDFPLQPILVGSYIDTFRRLDGGWQFASRRFEEHLRGDLSHHGRPGVRLPDAT